MTRWRALLGVGALAVLGVVVAAVVITNQPREYNARLNGYTCLSGDPRFLQIATSVGWNDHVVSANARQDRDKVTITVHAVDPEPRDQFQRLSATLTTATVVLREPLGDRLVVDQVGRTLPGQCPYAR